MRRMSHCAYIVHENHVVYYAPQLLLESGFWYIGSEYLHDQPSKTLVLNFLEFPRGKTHHCVVTIHDWKTVHSLGHSTETELLECCAWYSSELHSMKVFFFSWRFSLCWFCLVTCCCKSQLWIQQIESVSPQVNHWTKQCFWRLLANQHTPAKHHRESGGSITSERLLRVSNSPVGSLGLHPCQVIKRYSKPLPGWCKRRLGRKPELWLSSSGMAAWSNDEAPSASQPKWYQQRLVKNPHLIPVQE